MKIFTSTAESYAKFNGRVHVIRPLTNTEADLDETGPMFRCRTEDGRHFDAFGDELTEPSAPALLVHIYDADTKTLISESIDIRLAFPQIDDMDYVAALHDLMESNRHWCGGGAAPAFLIVAAHAQEPLHVLTGDL